MAHNHHNHNHHCHHCHSHGDGDGGPLGKFRYFVREIISGVLLAASVLLTHYRVVPEGLPTFVIFLFAVAPVAFGVLKDAVRMWGHLDFMNEFTLMLVASAGAFALGEYPEGVAVLLFYCFGEKLEDLMTGRVRAKVRNLIDNMPDKATVVDGDKRREVSPKDVEPGTLIAVSPGERLPLDGVLKTRGGTDFDTSAITGESLPRHIEEGEKVEAGVIPLQSEAVVLTTARYSDSSLARILKMIEEASATQSPTENLFRRITRYYTPIVFAAAALLILAPWIVSIAAGGAYDFDVWFKRSLVFLVCSCPCALVVGIPLSYFLAIGRGSSEGILFKGSRYIDLMRRVSRAFFDKTGTLTTGEFHIEAIEPAVGHSADEVLSVASAADAGSVHPLAKAICAEASARGLERARADEAKTVAHGIEASIGGRKILVGSRKLMAMNGIKVPEGKFAASTEIYVAADGTLLGLIMLADTVKPDVAEAISELHKLGAAVDVLSGDRDGAVAALASEIGADGYRAELLPGEKQKIVLTACKDEKGGSVIFTGDGINDAPALAAADVGIAMGSAGTALAVESAGVVIVGDDIGKIPEAVRLSRKVRRTVIEVVVCALVVKIAVMALGAFGLATLWAAVFADTGVTVLTVLWTIAALWLGRKKS